MSMSLCSKLGPLVKVFFVLEVAVSEVESPKVFPEVDWDLELRGSGGMTWTGELSELSCVQFPNMSWLSWLG